MNENVQKIVDYFNANKGNYGMEILISELQKSGYGNIDISEAVKKVYGDALGASLSLTANTKTSFWDFRTKRIYSGRSEKIIDYIFGLLYPWVIGFLIVFYDTDFLWVVLIIYLASLFYFYDKRKYIFRGLIFSLIVLTVPILFLIYFFRVFSITQHVLRII